jgi:hypothetical protein
MRKKYRTFRVVADFPELNDQIQEVLTPVLLVVDIPDLIRALALEFHSAFVYVLLQRMQRYQDIL